MPILRLKIARDKSPKISTAPDEKGTLDHLIETEICTVSNVQCVTLQPSATYLYGRSNPAKALLDPQVLHFLSNLVSSDPRVMGLHFMFFSFFSNKVMKKGCLRLTTRKTLAIK